MIGAFPDLYPDELLVSGWARYEAWVRYPQRKALLEDLFGYYKQSVDYILPSTLGAFVQRLPPGHSAASVPALISNHTLLPYYGALLPAKQQQALRQKMGERVGVNIQSPLGLSQSGHQMPGVLRYCPMCAVQDRITFEETYWHRLHQAAGVEVCPEHLMWLDTTDAAMWLVPGPVTFPLAEAIVPVSEGRPLNLENPQDCHLLRLARAAAWLLQHPGTTLEDFQLQIRCRVLLVEKGLASYGKRLKQLEILEDFKQKLTPGLLARLSCHWSTRIETTCWLSRLLQGGQNRPNFVLYSLLLILFLTDDVPTFLSLPTNFMPFGTGPWPCFNPACPHDGVRCIDTCDVYYHPDGFPRGTFTCQTCGFIYSRVGPDTSLEARSHFVHIKVHGPLWDTKLREVWLDPRLNIQKMSRALRCSWERMHRRATELDLPFPPPGVRPTSATAHPRPIRNKKQSLDPTPYRDEWLKIIQQNPDWGVNNIRQLSDKLYSWLRNNDHQWLAQHTPSRRCTPRKDRRVDWPERDLALAAEVKNGHAQLMARQEKPFRVTAHAILNEIRRRGYYIQNRDRLPQTEATLAKQAESWEAYAIRRIWHIARQFHSQGEVPRRRVLCEKAYVKGPTHRDNPSVQISVDEAMTWLREG